MPNQFVRRSEIGFVPVHPQFIWSTGKTFASPLLGGGAYWEEVGFQNASMVWNLNAKSSFSWACDLCLWGRRIPPGQGEDVWFLPMLADGFEVFHFSNAHHNLQRVATHADRDFGPAAPRGPEGPRVQRPSRAEAHGAPGEPSEGNLAGKSLQSFTGVWRPALSFNSGFESTIHCHVNYPLAPIDR